MTEVLGMGGYAPYVWTSYALALVILVVNFVMPWRREQRLRERIARQVKSESMGGAQE